MQTIILGIINGSIYALIALGIALVYSGSRVLNFAQAEIGTLTLYATYWVTVTHQMPWWLGALASIAAATAIGLSFERFIVRKMLTASRVSVAVATIGLFSLMLAIEIQFYSGTIYILPKPISSGGFYLAGVFVTWNQLLAIAVVTAIAAGLAAFLRLTDFGLAVRAAADDPVAAQLMGIPRGRVSAFTWGTAGALSAVAVLMIEPTVGALAPGAFSGLFIGGLTAALVGGLSSLSGAIVGGLAVGIAEAEVKAHVTIHAIPSPSVAAMLVIVLATLLIRPQGILGRAA
jgi:branched-chain amino acid transport system permease protein